MQFKHTALLLACLQIASVSALAAGRWEDRYGYYAAGSGGTSRTSGEGEIDIAPETLGLSGSQFEFTLEPGLIGSGAAGVYAGPMRYEFEIAYHSNDVDELSGPIPTSSASGDLTAISFILNGYYDFRIADPVAVYLGGGIGAAAIDFSATTQLPNGTTYTADADGSVVCWQLLAGVDLKVARRVHLTFGYRLWSGIGGDAEISSSTGATTITTTGSDAFDLPLIHSLEAGLRIDL